MLRLFIHKEIYHTITSKIFWVLFLIVFTLSILCNIIQISSYNSRTKAFQEYFIEHQKFNYLTPTKLKNVDYEMAIMPPAKLGMMFTGLKQFIGISSIDQNTISYLFKKIDFGILTGILFSLLAIILSFEAISGEREDGMLKLIDSYPVKRGKIIAGKWLGIIISIVAIYTCCYIITVLLIIVFANTQITSVDTLAMCIIYFIGLFYISGMVLLGIFISIKIRHSHLSLLTALFVWAIVILVLPSVPDYAGRLFVKVPSALQSIYAEAEIQNNKSNQIKKVKEKYKKTGISANKIEDKTKIEIEQTSKKYDDDSKKMWDNFENKLVRRGIVSTIPATLSPYACYILAVNEIAATGIASNGFLSSQRYKYFRILDKYFENLNNISKKDPKYKPDYSDIPKFEFKFPPLIVRLAVAATPFLLLLIFNILFFVLSFKSFLKYDVR